MEKGQEIIGQILSFIRERRYEPGDRLLSERDFSAKLGATRQSIREAVAALEALRVVERRPNSGIYLRNLESDSSVEAMVLHVGSGLPLSRSEVHDSMEVRLILEVESVKLACQRRTDADLVRLKANLKATKEVLEDGRTIESEDRDFHQGIVASTKNATLVRTVNWFYEMSEARRQLYFSDMKRCRNSYNQHVRIFRAIEAQDTDEAAKQMTKHLASTIEEWEELLST